MGASWSLLKQGPSTDTLASISDSSGPEHCLGDLPPLTLPKQNLSFPRPNPYTCPQADHNALILCIPLHDDGGQDLAAQQRWLKTVGEGIEAPVAQHSNLVMEGAARDGELRGQAGRCQSRARLPLHTPPHIYGSALPRAELAGPSPPSPLDPARKKA